MREHAEDFLVEIYTEELPPKALQRLAKTFLQEIEDKLRKAELAFTNIQSFATPRRLAILVTQLAAKQADALVERKGPALDAAFDKDGKPTPACAGFARSCGTTPDQLIKIESSAGTWMGYKQSVPGKKVQELLPTFVQQALSALPIPKRMRWGNKTIEFVRPVHSVIMLYGTEVIETEILGCRAGRKTRGHLFMSSEWLEINKPAEYVTILEKQGYVIVDFEQRKERIRQQAQKINPHVNINEDLLNEVTAIVEWPVAICGHFDKAFLDVPQEALISAMQDHQRYFPVVDQQGKLMSQFVAISNIDSKDAKRVIAGNERVLRARLSDAAFFFETDKKQSLESRVENLKHIIFQAKLGTLYDKTERISKLSEFIAKKLNINIELTKRAAWLSKTDLTTELVGEFPELQGTAGYYYALHDKEPKEIAIALKELYMPRFSGDALPDTSIGCAIAIADRVDTLTGIFSIGLLPTGDKDPFGLRRSALGILRILIEKKMNLDMLELLQEACKLFKTSSANLAQDVWNFMLDRLKPWYQDQHISPDVFAAVSALNISRPYDFDFRIHAVQAFKKLPEAETLSAANKRVSNILAKYNSAITLKDIDESLFENTAERVLADKLKDQVNKVTELSKQAQYQEALSQLATLRDPVDNFFDQVLVMTEDTGRRENRLLLLKKLRDLFLHVADIALLQ